MQATHGRAHAQGKLIKIVRHGKEYFPATKDSTKEQAHEWEYIKLCFRGSLQATQRRTH
jgi:hypothetical protein